MKLLSPKVDLVVERQWHVGIHARALQKLGLLGKVYGGFPASRYCQAGVGSEFIKTRPRAAYWNEVSRRLPLFSLPTVNEPEFLANWVSHQPCLSSYVVCYATAYRYLFPKLKNKNHVLVLERGSTHPENFFFQIQQGRKEAGFSYQEILPQEYKEEIKSGLLADFIVAGSRMIKESYVQRGYPAERVLYIPYAVDPFRFSYKERTQENRPLRIACVGVIGIRKGLQRLLWIGEWAKKKKVDCELWLIGPLEAEAKSLLEKTSAVYRLLGVRKGRELVDALHQCDVYALPSYEEGFGISVLEAMSTGLPAIVSKETGAVEAITDKKDGIILSDFSSDALDQQLNTLFQDFSLRCKMGAEARKKVESNYTLAHYENQLQAEYQRMFSIVENQD